MNDVFTYINDHYLNKKLYFKKYKTIHFITKIYYKQCNYENMWEIGFTNKQYFAGVILRIDDKIPVVTYDIIQTLNDQIQILSETKLGKVLY